MTWPLVGRDRELGFAGELLAQRSPGGLVLAGPAGVGKTRLAVEVSQIALARGCTVEWVRATRSAAAIPLGAFAALLPPTAAAAAGDAELLARTRHALVERAGGRPLVLCVDDGHLLDHGSAALVHQLAAAGEAFAVVTVRRGAPAPDAVRALWKDELCALLELEELSPGELERVLTEALGGAVDGRSLQTLWKLTRGNALFLRELVLYGVERKALVDDGGIWRWRAELAMGMRLAELVGARVEGLPPAASRALELVAVGAPLEVGLLDPRERVTLELLEAREIVVRRSDERRGYVDLAHPLHGEVVRARLSTTRRQAIQDRLANAVDAAGGRRREDVLRVAAWRMESGGGGDPELFLRAAEEALAALDPVLAERFAQAAVHAGGGFGARLALGRGLAGAGRAVEAEAVLDELERTARDDGERAAVAIAIARNLFWGLDRAGDAGAALLRAEQRVSDAALRDDLVAVRVRLIAARGRPLEALAAAVPLLRDAGVREQARLQAAVAVTESLLSCGRTTEAFALAETWHAIAGRHREELPLLEPLMLSLRAFALRLAGRLVEATELAEQTYAGALARRSAQTVAVEAAALGFIWLERGSVRTALRFFREGAALLRDADAVGMLPWALAGIAQAAALAGEPELARTTVEEMDRGPLGHKTFDHELALARAWSAAAAGELSRARTLATVTSELARSRGQDGFAARALHDLCRLGDPAAAAPGLAELAGRVDGPFGQLAAAHAAALVDGDGRALVIVAERFGELGALLVAAETAQAAAAAHRENGRESSARAAAARAAMWLEQCEGARPPTLLAAGVADELTPREREIALLAASGLSSRQIADRLVVSVRTIENHLQRTYRKLGIARRDELAALVAPPAE